MSSVQNLNLVGANNSKIKCTFVVLHPIEILILSRGKVLQLRPCRGCVRLRCECDGCRFVRSFNLIPFDYRRCLQGSKVPTLPIDVRSGTLLRLRKRVGHLSNSARYTRGQRLLPRCTKLGFAGQPPDRATTCVSVSILSCLCFWSNGFK